MADARVRDAYIVRRAEREATETKLMGGLAEVQRLERELAAAGGATARPDLAARLEDERTATSSLAENLDTLTADVDAIRREALTGDELSLLENDCPVLLLPVRLEVRAARLAASEWIFDDAAPATHLIVRIFPDQCHLDAHEPLLTDEEAAWAREYTDKVAASSQDIEDILPLWAQLLGRAGPQRARWLAAVGDDHHGRRPGPFSRGAIVRLLPDRWHVRVTFDDGVTTTAAASALVREPLLAGPDPRAGGDALTWTRNLPDAFAAGMAVAVALSGRTPSSVRRVTCAGVRAALTPDAAGDELEALITAHRCTDGLS